MSKKLFLFENIFCSIFSILNRESTAYKAGRLPHPKIRSKCVFPGNISSYLIEYE